MNCTALERQDKLGFLTFIVLLLQNKASKLGLIFWDTQYMNILSKLKDRFYCIKRKTKSKIRGQVKYKIKTGHFFSHAKQNEKNRSYLTQWHSEGF